MKKIISVIMVAYNADKTLHAALDSLIAQDIDKNHFEVVFIDDGSTDTTREIIAGYLASNSLPLSYYYQQNTGVGRARNKGVHYAQGDILAFTDADCICDTDRLSVIEKSIRQEKKQLIGGLIYCNDTVIFPRKMAPVHQVGVTANLAVDRSAVSSEYVFFEAGFSGMVGDDIDLVIGLNKLGIPLSYIAEMKVLHPANILTFERFLMRRKGRMNEIGLYKKHGKKVLHCFSSIYKPVVFGRISLFTIMTLTSILFSILIWQGWGLTGILGAYTFFIIVFMLYGYKALILYQPENTSISQADKLKTLFYFLLTIPLFFKARIQGIIKFKFFML